MDTKSDTKRRTSTLVRILLVITLGLSSTACAPGAATQMASAASSLTNGGIPSPPSTTFSPVTPPLPTQSSRVGMFAAPGLAGSIPGASTDRTGMFAAPGLAGSIPDTSGRVGMFAAPGLLGTGNNVADGARITGQ